MMTNEIKFSATKLKDDWFDQYSWSEIRYPAGLTPSDYLVFAENDLEEGRTQRHLINAISNAKRALHLEVETICNAFGLQALKKKSKNFPQKLDFLGKCGIVKRRLFEKMNNLRNVVEHEYYVPDSSEVEDFIDVVTLFVDAMKLNRMRYPCDVDIYNATDDSGEFHATSLTGSLEKGVLILKIFPVGIHRGETEVRKEITVDDDNYFVWLSFILKNNG
jgi:hypothetical protein